MKTNELPAFPIKNADTESDYFGITIRDYFAATAHEVVTHFKRKIQLVMKPELQREKETIARITRELIQEFIDKLEAIAWFDDVEDLIREYKEKLKQ